MGTEERREAPPLAVRPRALRWYHHPLTAAVSVAGGALGLVGALFQELQFFGPLPFVVAPVVEEVMKPVGVYLLLARWPWLLRGQVYTASITALGGLGFGVVENLVYLYIYVPQHTTAFVAFRFTAPLLMHITASFVVGMGLNRRFIDSMQGKEPFLAGSWPFFLGGIVLHAAYNITVAVLYNTGLISF